MHFELVPHFSELVACVAASVFQQICASAAAGRFGCSKYRSSPRELFARVGDCCVTNLGGTSCSARQCCLMGVHQTLPSILHCTITSLQTAAVVRGGGHVGRSASRAKVVLHSSSRSFDDEEDNIENERARKKAKVQLPRSSPGLGITHAKSKSFDE